VAAERSAVLLDWGGVMTGDLFGAFRAFSVEEGLDADVLANLFRHDRDARALLIDFECGRIEEVDFEPQLSTALGLTWHEGLIDRLFAGAALNDAMVDGVRAIHDRGIATGLVSNSWGTRRYPRDLLAELFDGVVISGEEGFRKPDPRMYELGAQRVGADPSACVFVDDLAFNLDPARELGMAVVHHTAAAAGPVIASARRLLCCAAPKASPREGGPARQWRASVRCVLDWCCRTTLSQHRADFWGQEPPNSASLA
jgi:epoxide hydrolase-like predicted phosphatase